MTATDVAADEEPVAAARYDVTQFAHGPILIAPDVIVLKVGAKHGQLVVRSA